MNSSKKVLRLRQAILKANTQLEQLRKSGMLDSSVEANVRYNKILIDKAICKVELDKSVQPFISKILGKLLKPAKREKLICDYFKS